MLSDLLGHNVVNKPIIIIIKSAKFAMKIIKIKKRSLIVNEIRSAFGASDWVVQIV